MMTRSINKVESVLYILLLHLIKRHAEARSTRSWAVSIRNAIDGVMRVNKRRKAGGYYLTAEELRESIEEIYLSALRQASLEALEGRYSDAELAERVDQGRGAAHGAGGAVMHVVEEFSLSQAVLGYVAPDSTVGKGHSAAGDRLLPRPACISPAAPRQLHK